MKRDLSGRPLNDCSDCLHGRMERLHELQRTEVLLCQHPTVLRLAPGPRWAAVVARAEVCGGRHFNPWRS